MPIEIQRLLAEEQVTQEYRFYDSTGELRWIRDELRLLKPVPGEAREAVGAWYDITADKQAAQVQQARIDILDRITDCTSLSGLLHEIAVRLEQISPRMRVSILLSDPEDHRLHTVAAPSLPADYNAAVDGLEPGKGRGSCGIAVATGEAVIVEDIRSHPYRPVCVPNP